MKKIRQEEVLKWLKDHKGERFSATRLKFLLNTGISIFPILKKLERAGDIKKEFIYMPENVRNKALVYYLEDD